MSSRSTTSATSCCSRVPFPAPREPSWLCLSHNHDGSLGAGNGTLEQQDVALVVDLDDIEVQHGRLVTAHASRHSLALEHASGGGTGADGTRGSVNIVDTVAGALALHPMALDHAG